MSNVVAFDGSDDDGGEAAQRRVQLRVPLHDTTELEAHLTLLALAIESCQTLLRSARKTGRHDDALHLTRRKLNQVNRAMNVKARQRARIASARKP